MDVHELIAILHPATHVIESVSLKSEFHTALVLVLLPESLVAHTCCDGWHAGTQAGLARHLGCRLGSRYIHCSLVAFFIGNHYSTTRISCIGIAASLEILEESLCIVQIHTTHTEGEPTVRRCGSCITGTTTENLVCITELLQIVTGCSSICLSCCITCTGMITTCIGFDSRMLTIVSGQIIRPCFAIQYNGLGKTWVTVVVWLCRII